MAKKSVSMRDIGRALGVSAVTVSKAIGGREGVGDALRQRILRTARDMGYQYDPPQPAEKEQKLIVGVVIADRYFGVNTFYAALYKELVKQMMEQGMLGVLEIIPLAREQELIPPTLISNRTVQALLVVGQMAEAYVELLAATELPMVMVDFYQDGVHADAVVSDGQMGTLALTAELIRRGHREIAFVGTVGMTSSSMDRCSGFARAMYSAGLQMRPEWFTGDRDEEGNILTALSLPEHLPTAFVCENDVVASVLAGQLMERGLKIPQDISVTGFDDFNYLPSPVALTTYAVDLPRMAEIAVRRLGARVARGPSTPVRIVVSGRVVQRDSVGDAPGCAGIPVKTDL